MIGSLQEHVHGFNKGITPCYISRIKHLQTPLSVDALETNPRHITICVLVLCVFLLLLLFKGIDLFLSSGTDVAARFPILTLQHRNIVQEIIWPICLHSEPTSPLSQECIQLKEHLCSLEAQLYHCTLATDYIDSKNPGSNCIPGNTTTVPNSYLDKHLMGVVL